MNAPAVGRAGDVVASSPSAGRRTDRPLAFEDEPLERVLARDFFHVLSESPRVTIDMALVVRELAALVKVGRRPLARVHAGHFV
jgi:hypothetical protein